MPRMPVTRNPEPSLKGTVILGPCPGCYCWTIQYEKPLNEEQHQRLVYAVESLLQEHLRVCSGMQEIVNAP